MLTVNLMIIAVVDEGKMTGDEMEYMTIGEYKDNKNFGKATYYR